MGPGPDHRGIGEDPDIEDHRYDQHADNAPVAGGIGQTFLQVPPQTLLAGPCLGLGLGQDQHEGNGHGINSRP